MKLDISAIVTIVDEDNNNAEGQPDQHQQEKNLSERTYMKTVSKAKKIRGFTLAELLIPIGVVSFIIFIICMVVFVHFVAKVW